MASCNAHFPVPSLIVLFQFINIVNGSAVKVLIYVVLHTGAGRAGRESWQEEGLLCHGACAYLTLIDTIIAEGLRAWAGTQTTQV